MSAVALCLHQRLCACVCVCVGSCVYNIFHYSIKCLLNNLSEPLRFILLYLTVFILESFG